MKGDMHKLILNVNHSAFDFVSPYIDNQFSVFAIRL